MRPDPEDRSIEYSRPSGPPPGLIIVGLIAITAVVYWYFSGGEPEPVPEAPAPPPIVAPIPEPQPPPPPAPDIPEPPPPAPPPPVPNEPQPPPVPAATLETSDAELRERLGGVSGSELFGGAMASDHLIERGTAAVDSLSRGGLLYKLLPITPPKGKFTVTGAGAQLTIDPAGYQRYNQYAGAIEALDTATLVATFHRFRPLMESTYEELGYQPEDFDNAVIRALDRILATPLIEEPIAVVKSEAIYKYVDPDLEQRTALEKQLLRMGPENVARIQKQARALRVALLAGS